MNIDQGNGLPNENGANSEMAFPPLTVKPLVNDVATLTGALGSSNPPLLGMVGIDPISGKRVEKGGPVASIPMFSHLVGQSLKLDYTTLFTPLTEGINRIIFGDFFPQIHEIVGEYPTEIRLTVISEKTPAEISSHRVPVELSIGFSRDIANYITESQINQFEELRQGVFKERIFACYAELYRQLIEPTIPQEIKESAMYGGTTFSHKWKDCWRNPAQVNVLCAHPYQGLPRSVRIDPYEVPQAIYNLAVKKFDIVIDDTLRQLYFGSIFPHMIASGIGTPCNVKLLAKIPAIDGVASDIKMSFAFLERPNKTNEYLRSYDNDFFRSAFPSLVREQLENLCKEKIFPEVARLPQRLSSKFTGLKFIIDTSLLPRG